MIPLLLRKKHKTTKSGFTIVVSKRIDKRASKRNRIKRLIRESLRRLSPARTEGTIIVKQNIAEMSQKEAEKMVAQLFYERNHT